MHRRVVLAMFVALVAVGCMTRHEVVVVPNEGLCQMYGVTAAEFRRAVETGPRNPRDLGNVVVKRLPNGRPIRLRQVASIHYREVGDRR